MQRTCAVILWNNTISSKEDVTLTFGVKTKHFKLNELLTTAVDKQKGRGNSCSLLNI